MDQHLGASITLSFALVVFFAVVLYEPEHAHLVPSAPEAALVVREEMSPVTTDPLPAVTPGEPLAASTPAPIAGPSSAPPTTAEIFRESGPGTIAARRREFGTRAGGAGEGTDPPATTLGGASGSTRLDRRPPRKAFTMVDEGETLRDVAARVYGSPDEADALWGLNRDLVKLVDVPLPAGTLLRTP